MADLFGENFLSITSSSSQLRPTTTDHDAPPASTGHGDADNLHLPRTKRIACHECAYDEVRKKSGPKRGYVKQLEARLAQVENLLRTQEPSAAQTQENHNHNPASNENEMTNLPDVPLLPTDLNTSLSPPQPIVEHQPLSQAYLPSGLHTGGNFGWDMLGLGLEEPLPTQDVIDELNQIYFDKVHPSLPFLHRPRHLAAMNLAYNIRPAVCLQYMTWCHAASVSDKYSNLHALFYQRARKYAELDEMKGFGESIVTLAHCQTWLLISTYEFKMMYFPRAWLSSGKATRLALMMGLNRLDGLGPEVKQSLPPPRDWTEKEERRRTFWMAFCIDRYASAGTGWPVIIDERDIMTNLPASETSFVKSKPERTLRLSSVMRGEGIATLSSLASVVLLSSMFGRNLAHLHRPDPQDNDHDLNGDHLRLPAGIADPNVVFCNMAIQTSTICLHQAAIFKAEKNKMPDQIITESKRRCIVAADQISSIMKMISHTDLTLMNPFMSFCVYVAARVFVQYLQSRPDDSAARSSLQFFFSALDALKNKNPMTESFLVQLDVDIEGTAFRDIRRPTGETPLERVPSFVKECASILPVHNEFQPSASLPNRQRRTPAQGQNSGGAPLAGPSQSFVDPSYNLSSGPETVGSGTDMDLSPGFDDNGNPISEGSTSSAVKSSSNTSYVGASSTSSPKVRQHSPLNFSNRTPSHTLGSSESVHAPSGTANTGQFDGFAYNDTIFSTDAISSLDTSVPDPPFPIPPSWDIAAMQTSNGENTNITPGTTGSLSETQWAELLNSNNWDAWRNQG
ncbi:hypothetical protein KXV92_001300 [Aspergillus fumigatus]|nr:hypothetical protein KXX42_009329 [Aspergillus fumigatus]KAH1981689.1 hypothetical protein KXW88_005410 [Aspergillus fumigatus]KAH2306026.1 hypothetical protein KXV47_008074 [Aspergillus fumigatus]KAH2767554.1 hypothetical protein KXV94_001797 [Aspergillus fumigatus]KAH2919235.1 hypothetical protein KXW25_005491 [Aspergillus fumigatus]